MVISLALVGCWLVLLGIVFGGFMRNTLQKLWREPVLREPVLIIESDDWGPGPATDAEALQRLELVLARHRDRRGKCAVMTLGMALAVPDTKRIREAAGRTYARALLSEPQFGPILGAIRHGVAAGTFSPQLHGMEHYWPDAIMKAARKNDEVHAWLLQEGVPRTEDLPSSLQSRWVDASVLPATELSAGDIASAATGEAAEFARLFGAPPSVVVPPTFVWNEIAEIAWARAGVQVVVTPGTRYSGRDAHGGLVAAGKRVGNGEASGSGMAYVVRDDYFEPALGHKAERALSALTLKARSGRPALLETHRFNFTGSDLQRDQSIAEVDRLLGLAGERFPEIRFMSTCELATAMTRVDSTLVESTLLPRLAAWLLRLAQIPRVKKIAWMTGAIIPAWLTFWAATAASAAAPRRGATS